jgi:hypothetical protein
MTNPAALRLEHPLDIDEARRASRRMAEIRREAEDTLERAVESAAATERTYRKAYASAFIQAEGTAGEREAKAKAGSAAECYERDLAAGMVKVCVERLRGLEGERSQLKSLTEWSMRIALDGREGDGPTFGGRRAA